MKIRIRPRRILNILLIVIASLTILSIIGTITKIYNFEGSYLRIFNFFDLNSEMNIPTFYSGLSLFIISLILFIIALFHKDNCKQFKYWAILSCMFLFISFDELVQFHERMSFKLQAHFDTSGIFFFAWIIPYGIILLTIGFFFIKFFKRLPQDTLKLFLFSGGVFIGGGIILEMIEGYYADLYGYETMIQYIATTLEEFLEMVGVAIFIYALLQYIKSNIGNIYFTITNNIR